MKTNPIARRLMKIRLILTALAIVALAAVEVGTGLSLANRIGQTTTQQSEIPQLPNLTFDDLMAAAR